MIQCRCAPFDPLKPVSTGVQRDLCVLQRSLRRSGAARVRAESQLHQIQAIGTPTGGQTTIATMDRLLAGDIAKIERNPALAGPAAFHDFAQVAHGYGLTACAPLS